jgi:hypothetical protein
MSEQRTAETLDFGHSKGCPVDGKPPSKVCTCGAEARARAAEKAERALRGADQGFVCAGCKNVFLQAPRCTTCGAEKLYDATVRNQQQTIASLQAEIDRLMYEYCPGEMTTEQIERWAAHQQATQS